MEEALWGFAGGIVAWSLTTLIFQPLVTFAALRAEVAAALSLHKNTGPFDRRLLEQMDEQEKSYQRERLARRELRRLAARLMAFHKAEPFAPKIIRRVVGIDPQLAARDLFMVSNTVLEYGTDRHEARKAIRRSLKLRSDDMSHLADR